MRSGLKHKPELSNIDYYDLLPYEVRQLIAHSAFDTKNCAFLYNIYQKGGTAAALYEVQRYQDNTLGISAYQTYGPNHPQAVRPNLMALRKVA